MRHVADAGRAGEIDALSADEHIRAAAAHAKTAERGVYGGEAVQIHEQGHARGRFRVRVGILGDAGAARASTEDRASPAQNANGVADSKLLNRATAKYALSRCSGRGEAHDECAVAEEP